MAHNLEDKPRTADVLIKENYTFNSLFLPENILQGLKDSGFHFPSPIQLKAIPLGRCGLDLIVKAKSGTGKTLVFTVLALENINVNAPSIQAIIIAPTREIAVQIEDVTKVLGKYIEGLKVACFIGGLPIEDDIEKVKSCHIAVGAPGRLKTLIEKQFLKTKSVRVLVLDEADKLMEDSFQADINYIYNNLPPRKQVLTISATYPDELDKFLTNYMHSPTFVTPDTDNSLLLGLQQFITIVPEHRNIMQQIDIKTNELIRLLSQISFTQCIVFFNFQTRAETLSHILKQRGWNALYISGSQPQTERLKVMKSLKKFECRILLTTDLTARGIDASNVNLVINYEVPFKANTYLHRMGRAGRYGSRGLCVTIAADGKELYHLQTVLGQIGGSELSIPKVPEKLDGIWECSVNDLVKVDSVVVNDDNVDMKQTVADLRSLYCNLKKLQVDEETSVQDKPEVVEQKIDESIVQKGDDDCNANEYVSANVLYPWVPIESSVLSKPIGENLLSEDDITNESVKKGKVTEDAKINTPNNIQLLTSNSSNVLDDSSQSVGNPFNMLQDEDKKREEKMQRFFESYSCGDILKNIAEHTAAWSKAECTDVCQAEDISVNLPTSNKSDKENIFKISYDFMTKNKRHWAEVVSDYYSSEEETEDLPHEDSSITEDKSETELMDTNVEMSTNYTLHDSYSHDNYDVPMFNQLYDKCSEDVYNYAGTFSEEASSNEWYDSWRIKLSSVTKYVQQNLETYENSQYQYSVYLGNKF